MLLDEAVNTVSMVTNNRTPRQYTNLALFRHASTSGGSDEET